MTYEAYANWAEDVTNNIMTKKEFLQWQKEQLISNVEHNKELLQALYKGKSIPEYVTHVAFYNYKNDYDLMYGAELQTRKKYHILCKVLENGHIEGLDTYPDWFFNTENYNSLYYGIEGVTESKYNNRSPYPFRLNDDDLFLIKEII